MTLEYIIIINKVKLAKQVLSKSVMLALQQSDDEEVLETARFCGTMNDFFDCTNVRSLTEFVRKRNQFIKPYESSDDKRFAWLVNVFLKYLDDWKQSTIDYQATFHLMRQNVPVPADIRGVEDVSLFAY